MITEARIAVFFNTQFDYEVVGQSILECLPSYTRLSEYIDVKFIPLQDNEPNPVDLDPSSDQ